ncbi:MAG: peptidoglycan-associated lipoprotein Pal [Rhizobiales bacterium]|nr:peptidoglycan-associated lipoprotein Pal [Hyphomicrobiales bacterium]
MPFSVSVRKVVSVSLMALALFGAGCANQQKGLEAGLGAGAGGVATPGSAQDFQVNVGDRIFFESDSSTIAQQGLATLDKQVQWLAQYPNYTFILEGHADERGTREYNLALGARRSTAVRDYMISRGVAANRMRTVSFGKERPVAVCDNISCWSQNRRAVTVLDGAGA